MSDQIPGRETALLRTLPREDPVPEREADDLVAILQSEGLVGHRRSLRIISMLAAAAVLLAAGAVGGVFLTNRNSLERALARTDLTVSDRILLLQRAGSAYVRAAQQYADAVDRTDSTAMQVASHVLVGAASAVARSQLDGGLSARLTSVLAAVPAPAAKTPNIIWY
jgi:hypothetical protein